MPRSLKSKNPFYALLVIAGITFALTATAYCVMAFREVRHPLRLEEATPATPHPLVEWMHHNGEAALLTELASSGRIRRRRHQHRQLLATPRHDRH